MTKKAGHYVDKEQFVVLLSGYNKDHDAICLILQRISQGVVGRFTWTSEDDREDAISNAMLHCLKNVGKFDTTRHTSPLAYFSTLAKHEIMRFLEVRSRQLQVSQLPSIDDEDDNG